MANKTMHHVVIGSDTFEIVDQYAREHSVTIDSTLTQSGQAADAKAVGDAVDALDTRVTAVEGDIGDVEEDLSANIGTIAIAQTDLTSGYFCNQYGLPAANSNYSISGYIDISDFAKYGRNIKFPVTLASAVGCVITDVRGIVLVYVNGLNASTYGYTNGYSGYISIPVPTGAKYIRTSIATADIQTIGTLAVYGELVSGIYNGTLSKAITDAIFSGDNFVSENLWDVTKIDFAGYYGANGTYTENDGYPSLTFTDISGYDLLSIAMGITPQNLLINLVFWDANQSRISGTSTNKTAGSTYSSVVAIPKGAKYFTINSRKSENIPQPFEIHAIKRNPLTKGLKGKKLSILGDSISTYAGYIPEGNETYYTGSNAGVTNVDQTWWKRVIDYYGLELCVNNSWSGSTISSARAGSYPNSSGVDRAESLNTETSNPDIIIVYMGTNDFRWDVPLGDYDGSQDFPTTFSTFKNAIAMMLKKILTKYPTAITYICTLKQFEHYNDLNIGFPDKNGIGLTTDDYTNAILDMATLFGVPVIDFNKSGLNYFNLAQYAGDYNAGTAKGLHPNAAGHKKLADRAIHDLLGDLT